MRTELPSSQYIDSILNKLSYFSKSKANLIIKGKTGSRKGDILKLYLQRNNLSYNLINLKLVTSWELFQLEWNRYKDSNKILILESIQACSKDFQQFLYKEILNSRNQNSKIWIISISNYEINELIKEKSFLQELYQSLGVSILEIQSISEIKKELPILAKYYLDIYSKFYNKRLRYFEPEFMDIIMKYDFPGDLEELENLIHQAVISGKGRTISIKDFPKNFYQESKTKYHRKLDIIPGVSMREYEREIIRENLKLYRGNREITAKNLDISLRTLYRKIDEFGLKD